MNPCTCYPCFVRRELPWYDMRTPCLAPLEAPDDGPTLPGGWDVEPPHYVSIEGGLHGR